MLWFYGTNISTFAIRGYINSTIIFSGTGQSYGKASALTSWRLRPDECTAISRSILKSNPYFHLYNAVKKFLNSSIIPLTLFYKSGILFFKDGDGNAPLLFIPSFFP